MEDYKATLEALPKGVAMPEEWLSQDDLINRWKVSKTTIRRLRQSGKLPAFRITNSLFRFKLVDILRIEKSGAFLPALGPRRRRKS